MSKNKHHSRNKGPIIDSPIYPKHYSRALETSRRSKREPRRDSRTYFFRERLFHRTSGAVREITLTTISRCLCFGAFVVWHKGEARSRSAGTKVDRDDQLSWRPIDYRDWIIAHGPTPFRSDRRRKSDHLVLTSHFKVGPGLVKLSTFQPFEVTEKLSPNYTCQRVPIKYFYIYIYTSNLQNFSINIYRWK